MSSLTSVVRTRLKPLPLPEWDIVHMPDRGGASYQLCFRYAFFDERKRWMPSRFNPLFPSWKGSDRHPFAYAKNGDLPIGIPSVDDEHICRVEYIKNGVNIVPLDEKGLAAYEALQDDYRNWLRQEIDLAVEEQNALRHDYLEKLLIAMSQLHVDAYIDEEPVRGDGEEERYDDDERRPEDPDADPVDSDDEPGEPASSWTELEWGSHGP